MNVEHEVKLLVQEMKRLGKPNSDGKITVKFGVLFSDDRCANIFEGKADTNFLHTLSSEVDLSQLFFHKFSQKDSILILSHHSLPFQSIFLTTSSRQINHTAYSHEHRTVYVSMLFQSYFILLPLLDYCHFDLPCQVLLPSRENFRLS